MAKPFHHYLIPHLLPPDLTQTPLKLPLSGIDFAKQFNLRVIFRGAICLKTLASLLGGPSEGVQREPLFGNQQPIKRQLTAINRQSADNEQPINRQPIKRNFFALEDLAGNKVPVNSLGWSAQSLSNALKLLNRFLGIIRLNFWLCPFLAPERSWPILKLGGATLI